MKPHHLIALLGCATLLGCTTRPEVDPAKGTKAPLFSCYRTIYNNSDCPWTFGQSPSDVHQKGNMYFGDGTLPNCTHENGPCTVPPKTSIPLHYTYTANVSRGTLVIRDRTDTSKSFSYLNNWPDDCPYIQHSGGTGAVALNDPADGDLNAWGACTWADGANKPWPRPWPARP